MAGGIVFDIQPLKFIPPQQFTMEEMNYPSESLIEEVAEDVRMKDCIIPQSLIQENPHSTPHQTTQSPVLLSSVPSAGISSEIGRMLTYHTLPDSPEKRKAMEEEITRVNQQTDEEADWKKTDEEANRKKTDDLAALRNDMDKFTTKITGIIGENLVQMRHAVENITKEVRDQATTSVDHQDLVKKVNLLQQSQDVMSSLLVKCLAEEKMVEGENFRFGDDPAPLYDPLLESISQKHLDQVETAIVVHTICKDEVLEERLIYFLKRWKHYESQSTSTPFLQETTRIGISGSYYA